MRLTVFLFLTLALSSITGTLLPQGTSLEELERHYGPAVSWWIEAIGLNDLYQTGWFRTILLLLSINLIICTIQRLPKTLKLIQHRDEQISPEKLEKFNCHTRITITARWPRPRHSSGSHSRGVRSPATARRLRGLSRRCRKGPLEPPHGLYHSPERSGHPCGSDSGLDLRLQGIHEFG